jgi:hypothetical protein
MFQSDYTSRARKAREGKPDRSGKSQASSINIQGNFKL